MKRSFTSSLAALTLALCLMLSACGASSGMDMSKNEAMPESSESMMDSAAPAAPPGEGTPDGDRGMGIDSAAPMEPMQEKNIKLIWRASVSVETLNYDELIEKMNESVKEYEGFIESSETYGGKRLNGQNMARGGSYTVRIPTKNLDAFLNQVGTIGNVTDTSKWSENITLDYADNEARKQTLELEEQKLLELLKQATRLEDIIQLEARLSELHYQLDGYASTLRRYDDLIDYSTVTLSVHEVKRMSDVSSETFGERISSGFRDSLYRIRIFAEEFLIFLIADSPILLIVAVVIVLIVLLIRKLRRKKAKLPPAPKKNPPAGAPSEPKQDAPKEK